MITEMEVNNACNMYLLPPTPKYFLFFIHNVTGIAYCT